MIEKNDNELQVIKYNNKQGYNLKLFLEQLKTYYSNNSNMLNYISALEIVGEDSFSIIKNIPDVYIGEQKLITILLNDLIKLLYTEK